MNVLNQVSNLWNTSDPLNDYGVEIIEQPFHSKNLEAGKKLNPI